MVSIRCLMLALSVGCSVTAAAASKWDIPTKVTLVAHVTDHTGAPVSEAKVWMHQAFLKNRDDITLAPSVSNPGEYRYEGPLPKDTKYPDAPCALVAQSPSGAVAYALTTINTLPADFKLRLPKNQPVRVKVTPWKGAPPLPANARLTATPDPLLPILSSNVETTGGLVAAVREGEDVFVLPVDPESTQTRVQFDAPGYLRIFVAPALKPGEATQTIELPEPGRLKISYAPAERFKATPPYKNVTAVVSLYEKLEGPYNYANVGVIREDKKGTQVEFDIPDLAPGQYGVLSSTHYDNKTGTDANGPAAGDANKSAMINSGKTETFAMEYDDIDIDRFRGNLTADLTVVMPDGKPATGQEYQLKVRDMKGREATLTTGTVAANGKALLKGLTAGFDDQTTDRQRIVSYDLVVGDREAVPLRFYKIDPESRIYHATSDTLVLEIKLPPGKSDLAPDVKLQKMDGTGFIRIADFRGKVLVLDFWATWCGPCQEPMAHLNELAVKNADAYKDKVELVGASIDDDLKTLQDHVRKNGWDKITQAWCGPEGDVKPGFNSVAGSAYGIRGVPTTFIIDREGKILWRGHPAGLPEEMIDKLAKEN